MTQNMEGYETGASINIHNITKADSVNYTYPYITLSLSLTSSSLSIFGGLFIIASYKVLPEIRNFTRKLVVSLTVADILTAVGIWVSVVRYLNLNVDFVVDKDMEGVLCKLQSFLTTLTSLASFFMTSFIAVYIFDTVTSRTDRLNSTKWLVVFNAISWIIPGCIVTVANAMNVLGGDPTPTGVTGPWCWISETADNEIMWRFVSGKGWEIACYLITTMLYIGLKFYIYKHYKRQKFHAIQVCLRDEDKNFLYVWLILYVLRLWGTLRFFLRLGLHPTGEEDYMYGLLYMQALGDPAQSFCNFLLFCVFDETVRIKMLEKIFCCKKMNKNKPSDDTEELMLENSDSYGVNSGYGSTLYRDHRNVTDKV